MDESWGPNHPDWKLKDEEEAADMEGMDWWIKKVWRVK